MWMCFWNKEMERTDKIYETDVTGMVSTYVCRYLRFIHTHNIDIKSSQFQFLYNVSESIF